MPDVSGVTVVTNACAFYQCARGCGRAQRPAFPAPLLGVARPLIEEGGTVMKNSREMRGENAKACPGIKSFTQEARGNFTFVIPRCAIAHLRPAPSGRIPE